MTIMTGVRIRASLLDGGDLGDVHAPPPVVVGDVVALSVGPPLKVVAVTEGNRHPPTVTVRPLYLDARGAHQS